VNYFEGEILDFRHEVGLISLLKLVFVEIEVLVLKELRCHKSGTASEYWY
jgi:hypothetical protein